MAARPIWKGFIRFSLVSIPVRAYGAAAEGAGGIAFNQLHKDCGAPVRYKKRCPIHGEIPNDEIVSGYQVANGQYVTIDPTELEKLRSPRDKATDIQAFIEPSAVEPTWYAGRSYYLVPDGAVGRKPYALLYRAMVEGNHYAFAQVVFIGREQLVLLRRARAC